uniref:E3 ubiquitin-protein ligase TRIM21-like n=1 Tax=Cyprinodon variegatus TaxID=28743 RepID=A0A3Q2CY62_CYPVA
MSSSSNLRSEDQFLCSICLDVFTDPVSTPCGHNFCKACITQHWDGNVLYNCPLCKELFTSRPQLKVNTFIKEMVAKFRREAQQENRRVKIQEIKESVKISKDAADHEKFDGFRFFTRLAVAQLEEKIREEMKKMMKAEMKRVQQSAVDVTLDPDTAHPDLILSDDGKQVKHGDVKKNLPDNPERFSKYANVLGRQSFSSGRFYFEVQVKGKTKWTLGVARESINRKGEITVRPQNGYWTIVLRNSNEYSACADFLVRLHLHPAPEKVGVFVDYEEGLVSFYDVDAAALIYSFTGCCFTQKLYPFFCPCLNDGGKNSAPLIICPVNQADG